MKSKADDEKILPSLLPLKALGLERVSLQIPARGLLSLGSFSVLHICCPQKRKVLLTAGAAGGVPALNEYQAENVLLRGRGGDESL